MEDYHIDRMADPWHDTTHYPDTVPCTVPDCGATHIEGHPCPNARNHAGLLAYHAARRTPEWQDRREMGRNDARRVRFRAINPGLEG